MVQLLRFSSGRQAGWGYEMANFEASYVPPRSIEFVSDQVRGMDKIYIMYSTIGIAIVCDPWKRWKGHELTGRWKRRNPLGVGARYIAKEYRSVWSGFVTSDDEKFCTGDWLSDGCWEGFTRNATAVCCSRETVPHWGRLYALVEGWILGALLDLWRCKKVVVGHLFVGKKDVKVRASLQN